MELIIFILNALFILIAALFLKFYVPSYMSKKGENLATKEDIQEITKKTEEVQQEFKESFQTFSSDLKFKYEFYYRQYTELYCNLYSIVIQSEYVREFIFLTENKKDDFEEIPFLEISPTSRTTTKYEFNSGKPPIYKQETTEIETPISQFNKKQLCDYIIEHSALASQNLIKLAVAYRFANSLSGDTELSEAHNHIKIANNEELRLIKDIVICIVREYNILRQRLKIDFDENELETGHLQL